LPAKGTSQVCKNCIKQSPEESNKKKVQQTSEKKVKEKE
jgi:hypothetical protein